MIKNHFFLFLIFALSVSESLCSFSFANEFQQKGYVEICDEIQEKASFDTLYERFNTFIHFLQTHPKWAQKLYIAKEHFVRSKGRALYSTDFFGFYDESERRGRDQIAFYYSPHFHAFICSRYPEFNQIPEIVLFFEACFMLQKPYGLLFTKIAKELGLETIFSSEYDQPPVLFKVIKYLPSYMTSRPHYDGTAFSLFLDSTDDSSLLLSPYKPSFTVDDFSSPLKKSTLSSILLIPGTLLCQFSIYPTPHIVVGNGKIRYATIAFAMRPHHISQKNDLAPLPLFKNIE